MEEKVMNMHRRSFVRALSLGTAHLLFTGPLYAGCSKYIATNPVQKVKLGNSGIETSLIGFGTGIKAHNRSSFLNRQDKNKSLDLLHHAIDSGIRFFDCADSYGTHDLVAEALQKANRSDFTLSTKMWVMKGGIPEEERPDADIVVDRFRKELNTDYLDMVQIHCMFDGKWTDTYKRQMDILENLKVRGIIRAHGVSVHSLDAMKAAAESPWVDVIHVRINPYGIAMDKPDPAEVVEVINQMHQSGKGVIGMKLIGEGRLSDDSEKIDHSLQFVLGLGSVDMMIVGFEENEQIDNYLERTENALKKLQG
jgi:aryl-alcohol dehydrogenase-like predicted oxidoreductase